MAAQGTPPTDLDQRSRHWMDGVLVLFTAPLVGLHAYALPVLPYVFLFAEWLVRGLTPRRRLAWLASIVLSAGGFPFYGAAAISAPKPHRVESESVKDRPKVVPMDEIQPEPTAGPKPVL